MPIGHPRGWLGKSHYALHTTVVSQGSGSIDTLHRFDTSPQELAQFVFGKMTDYEVYFEANQGRVAAYASHYQTADAILDANADVEADGE